MPHAHSPRPSRPNVLGRLAVALLLCAPNLRAGEGRPAAPAVPLARPDAATIKRLNDALAGTGLSALPGGALPGEGAWVGLMLGEDAARSRAAPLPPPAGPGGTVREPLSAGAAAALLGGVRGERKREKLVADSRGITRHQVEELHEERRLAFADFLTLPAAALRRAVFETEGEAADHPEEAMRWRESFLADETGNLDPAAIERARRWTKTLSPTKALDDVEYHPTDPTRAVASGYGAPLYLSNDGGVYRAADVSTVALTSGWQELNNQLGTTQFYGAAGVPSSGVVIAGAQDDGTENWTTTFGGDGGYCAADPTNGNYLYGEYVYLDIHRSTNGGASSAYIYPGLADANSGSTAEFIAPFILDPNNPATLLAGGKSLWRTTNARAATVGWSAVKASDGNNVTAIAVAPGNSDVIWVGHTNGNVYKTLNGTAAPPAWTKVDDNATALPARRVARTAVDPASANRVFVTFGGYSAGNVWGTTDGGAS